jgi:hypothetical protein
MSPNTQFLNLEEAQTLLAEFGIVLNLRQIKRAAEPNAQGKRKLPFFVDPIEGRLRIEKSALLGVYRDLMKSAENNTLSLE